MFDDFRLRVFKAVASEGSFTKAAKSLDVSQPAVSQNIANLEENLGVQLFERLKGEVRLTGNGRIFESYADRILFWYDSLPAIFESGKNNTKNSLVIVVDGTTPRNIIQNLTNFLSDVNPLMALTFCSPHSPLASEADIVLKSTFAESKAGTENVGTTGICCESGGIGANAAGVISAVPSPAFAQTPLCAIVLRFLKEALY